MKGEMELEVASRRPVTSMVPAEGTCPEDVTCDEPRPSRRNLSVPS